jgi:hypothetical protein
VISVAPLTQIRKQIPTVIAIPYAGALKGIELGRREGPRGNRQCNGLVQSLLAGKTHPPFTSLIRMFVAIATPTFDTGSQGWIFTTVRDEIPDDHFALFSHAYPMLSVRGVAPRQYWHHAEEQSLAKRRIAALCSQ